VANHYRSQLLGRSKDRFRDWNKIVVELKQITMPFVQRKIEAVARENNLAKAFENAVQWDILHLCMESEYADICPPGFYAGQAYWYTKGHFPCGWKDEPLQEGRPIIY